MPIRTYLGHCTYTKCRIQQDQVVDVVLSSRLHQPSSVGWPIPMQKYRYMPIDLETQSGCEVLDQGTANNGTARSDSCSPSLISLFMTLVVNSLEMSLQACLRLEVNPCFSSSSQSTTAYSIFCGQTNTNHNKTRSILICCRVFMWAMAASANDLPCPPSKQFNLD